MKGSNLTPPPSDPTPHRRVEQLNSLVHQEIATVISREIEFPSGMFVTVSRVQVADDAASAKVWLSVLPATHQDEALKIVLHRIADVQSILNKRLVMKFVPKLTFVLDESNERATHITQVLDAIQSDGGLGLKLDAEKVEGERRQREEKNQPAPGP